METPLRIFSQTTEYNRESDDYAADWEEYRRLRRKFFLILLGVAPAVAVAAVAGHFFFDTYALAFPAYAAYIVWVTAEADWLQFICPRCGEIFGTNRDRGVRTGGYLHGSARIAV